MKTYNLTIAEVSLIGRLLDPQKGHSYDGEVLSVQDDDEIEIVDAALVSIADRVQEAAKASLIAYVADKRWRVETGGIVVGGMLVATDDRSKLMITGVRVKADNDAAFTTNWKTPAGFVEIGAATIIALSDAVLAHVDACFAAEAAVLAEIEAGTITTTAEVDAAEWP